MELRGEVGPEAGRVEAPLGLAEAMLLSSSEVGLLSLFPDLSLPKTFLSDMVVAMSVETWGGKEVQVERRERERGRLG